MDRTLTYPASLPMDTDILQPQRNAMIAFGFLAQAAFGTSTLADGLVCTPTPPASMSVLVGPGSLLTNLTVDSTAYGSLAADTTNALVKMGINLGSTTIGPFTAPGTAGQSQNFLIQASLSETDTGSTVLPYYNASNPSAPYSGPGNAGTAQNTRRVQTVTLSLKSGAAATTGSQTTPAPDAGYVGLWVITIANGATTITAPNITEYQSAPFLRTKLPATRWRLTANLTIYVATTGNDSNSGLSALTPLATLNAAWQKIVKQLDLAGFTVTVSVADGTYAPLTCDGVVTGSLGELSVQFVGNTTTPANCIISATNASAVTCQGGAQITVNGFQFTATGTGAGQGAGVYAATAGSRVRVGTATRFSTASVSHMVALSAGQVAAAGGYTITGAAPSAWQAGSNGVITHLASGVTVTVTGTPAFSTAFAVANTGGVIAAGGLTFSGTATGSRYAATGNGVINTNGGGGTYLPGDAVGTTATGGQYV